MQGEFMNKTKKNCIGILFFMLSTSIIIILIFWPKDYSRQAAISVVRNNLEAKKNNDYDSWRSTMWDQLFTSDSQRIDDFGIVKLDIKKIEISNKKTEDFKERYANSEFSQKWNWTSDWLNENSMAVVAEYYIINDHSITGADDGNIQWCYYLIRENPEASWVIFDGAGDVEN